MSKILVMIDKMGLVDSVWCSDQELVCNHVPMWSPRVLACSLSDRNIKSLVVYLKSFEIAFSGISGILWTVLTCQAIIHVECLINMLSSSREVILLISSELLQDLCSQVKWTGYSKSNPLHEAVYDVGYQTCDSIGIDVGHRLPRLQKPPRKILEVSPAISILCAVWTAVGNEIQWISQEYNRPLFFLFLGSISWLPKWWRWFYYRETSNV